MKTIVRLSGLLILILAIGADATQLSQVHLYCLSVRISRGSTADGLYALELSSISGGPTMNGELLPSFTQPDHVAYFVLDDPTEIEPIMGQMAVDVPSSDDVNQNGFPDFYEASQACSGKTTGEYITPFDSGTVQATWKRAAGATRGTCTMRLTSDTYGQLPDFNHFFDLLEYTGTLPYLPGTNTVTGQLNLALTGTPDSQWSGPILLVKSATNRFNQLEIQPGNLTNSTLRTLVFTNDFVQRDQTVLTNYYGYLDFEDGDLDSPDPDFLTWLISIDDPNDANQNGIPDFSDDPVTPQTQRPTLALSRTGSELNLIVTAPVGMSCELQSSTALPATVWAPTQTITITNQPQSVSLAYPAAKAQFWRLRVL
jgi:hypothetical protein